MESSEFVSVGGGKESPDPEVPSTTVMNAAPSAHLATDRSIPGNLRRMVRRQPDMGSGPVDAAQVAHGLLALVFSAILGVAMVLLTPGTPPMVLVMLTGSPIAIAHTTGVRHRWWALGIAAVIGSLTGVGLGGVLRAMVGPHWAALISFLGGSLAAMVAYAAVTHVRSRVKGRR